MINWKPSILVLAKNKRRPRGWRNVGFVPILTENDLFHCCCFTFTASTDPVFAMPTTVRQISYIYKSQGMCRFSQWSSKLPKVNLTPSRRENKMEESLSVGLRVWFRFVIVVGSGYKLDLRLFAFLSMQLWGRQSTWIERNTRDDGFLFGW